MIFITFGCIVIYYSKSVHSDYMFYFVFFSLTSDLRNSPNPIVSKFLLYLNLTLLHHGDIESNPGSDKPKLKTIFCCHWNVNGLVAHNFSKLCQLES